MSPLEAATKQQLVKTIMDWEDLVRKQEITNLFNYKTRKISNKW
jgi:hypothetical protein